MKKFGLILLFLFLVQFNNHVFSSDLFHYKVTKSKYLMSTEFEMTTDRSFLGSVKKNKFFPINTHYDAFNVYGLPEGRGVCRILSLGLFWTWATEIDVTNDNGEPIGMIDGQVFTAEPGKFSFYNSVGQHVAIAYLEKNCVDFNLVDPENSSYVLARLSRNFILDTVDNWNVSIYAPEKIDPFLVKIFAAFVCDKQDKFKPDK